MKKTKFKLWQTIVLISLGLMAICFSCMGGLLAINFIRPTEQPSRSIDLPTAELAINNPEQPPTETPTTEPPAATELPLPTETQPAAPVFTETPTENLQPVNQAITRTGPASCVPANTQTDQAAVLKIIDGDTIDVVIGGASFRVRYIGIDTPEDTSQVEYFGPEATAKNTELVMGQTLTLIKDVSETDKYDRLLRYVFAGDVFVNYELVRQGFANAATYPPDVACSEMFNLAEQQAHLDSVGLWALALPIDTLVPANTSVSATATKTKPVASGPCNCSGPDLNCSDFSSHSAAQACFDYCRSQGFGDVFRLDGDKDGLACEG